MNKRNVIMLYIVAMLVAGAGCTSVKSNDQSTMSNGSREGFVERRTENPPEPPANIPLPTPIQPTTTEE